MKQVNVGILGATGAVGQEMIKILEERNFPVASLRPIASARSAGSKIMFRGQECTIVEASDDAFEGLDIVLGAAENDIAERFAPSIVKAGAVFVDNSSAFRLDPNVPLVIPEINPEDVKWHKGIISNPNCTTIVTLVAINALAKESPIETIIASSYQAVSGAGKGGIDELNNEVKALSEGKHLAPKVFQYQIAYNIIPQIGNNFIINIKDTSVMFVIGFVEFFATHRNIVGNNLLYFPSAIIEMAGYLILTLAASFLLRLLEKRLDGSDNYELVSTDSLAMSAGTYSHPSRKTPFDERSGEFGSGRPKGEY